MPLKAVQTRTNCHALECPGGAGVMRQRPKKEPRVFAASQALRTTCTCSRGFVAIEKNFVFCGRNNNNNNNRQQQKQKLVERRVLRPCLKKARIMAGHSS
jgi:hypothetical protein